MLQNTAEYVFMKRLHIHLAHEHIYLFILFLLLLFNCLNNPYQNTSATTQKHTTNQQSGLSDFFFFFYDNLETFLDTPTVSYEVVNHFEDISHINATYF